MKKMIATILAVLIALSSVIEFKMSAYAAPGIEYHGKVSYGGTIVGHFTVDDQLAFCIEHEKSSPPTGTAFHDEIYYNEDIRKALYYGWGGAAQWGGFESEAHGIVATSLTVSHYYAGTNIKSANQSFYDWLQTQSNAPDNNISISKSKLESYVEGNVQRTEDITLGGDSRNAVTFPLPEGVKLHNVTSGKVGTGKVTVACGEKFFLTAPLSMNDTWKSGELKGKLPVYQSVLSVASSAGLQNLVRNRASDPTSSISLTVKWEALGKAKLKKVDSKTGKGILGTVLGVYKDKACTELIEKLTTGSSGTVSTSKLPEGTYYVKELKAAKGYVLSDKIYKVELEAGKTVTIEIDNSRTNGKITITKTDEETGKGLAGAEFGLYAADTIEHPDGQTGTLYKKDQLVKKFPATASTGKAMLDKLYLGDYYIKETKAPAGYQKNNTKYPVSLTYGGQEVSVVTATKKITNKRVTGKITVTKTDEETGQGLIGAEFGLYAANTIEHPDGHTGTLYKKDQLVKKFPATASTGKAMLDKLYLGDYYIKETKAPAGYQKNNTKYSVSLTYGGQEVSVVTATKKVTNKRVTGKITITKVDKETGQAQGDASLKGAVYGLYAANTISHPDGHTGMIYRKDQLVKQFPVTASTGQAMLDKLYLGDYYIKEISPSPGYLLDTTKYPVSLTYSGQEVSVAVKEQTVKEQVIKGRIQLVKHLQEPTKLENTNKPQKPEEGAEFQVIHKASKKVMDTIVTDSDGFARTKLLPYGLYTIHQTKGKDGYALVDDFDVMIQADGRTYSYILENYHYSANLKVVKKDAVTGKIVAIAGATFQILDFEGKVVEQDIYYPKRGKISEFQTDKNGTLMLPEPLVYGDYTLVEKKAPDGYLIADPIPFTVSKKEISQDEWGDEVVIVNCSDIPVKGKIRIKKTGKVLTGFQDGKFIYEEKGLAGCVFTVKAAENIYSPDNSKDEEGNRCIIYKKGELIEELTTDENGEAETGKYFPGHYIVAEKEAPDGFIKDPKEQKVELKYKDQETELVFATSTVYNENQRYSIEVVKTDSQTKEPLAGAEFSLYANQDILNAKGEVIVKADTLLHTLVTGKTGQAEADQNLPVNVYASQKEKPMYKLVETKTPEGYVKEDTAYFLSGIPEPGKVLTIKKQNIENKPTETSVLKVDENGNPISGAVLRVREKEAGFFHAFLGTDVADEWTTDGKPHRLKKLEIGKTYVLEELEAPAGFVTADSVEFTIKDTEEVQIVKMTDKKTKVSVLKTDEKGNPVSGAVLQIQEEKSGKIVEEWTTAKEAKEFTGLPVGDYKLIEKKAPKGYVTANPVVFTVKDTEEVQKIVMEDKEIKVSILKTDEKGESVPGAVLQLEEAESGEVIEKWTTTREAKEFTGLAKGKYKLLEVKAPKGYATADPVVFTVKDTEEVQKIRMKDETVKGKLILKKADAATGKKLAGAEFELQDENGKVLETLVTGKDGTAESKEYDIGIYQGQEHIRPLCYYLAETKAPEGYLLDSTPIEIIFEWKNGKKLVIEKDLTVTNKATEKKLPQTGEFPTGKLMTAAGILCIGTAAVLGICSKKKDRKKGKHEE